MSSSIKTREKEGILILDMEGPFVAGEPAAAFRDKVREALAAGKRNLILNLAGVDYIDSTGLGEMVFCFTTLQKKGGRLALLNLNSRHIELLVLTKLSTVFDVFDDEQSAVNSFFPDREIRRFDILSFVEQQRDL